MYRASGKVEPHPPSLVAQRPRSGLREVAHDDRSGLHACVYGDGTRGSPFPRHRCPPVLWGFACRFRERSLCRGGDPEATSLGLHDWFPHLVLVVQVGQFLVDEVVLARVLPQEEGDFQGLQVLVEERHGCH